LHAEYATFLKTVSGPSPQQAAGYSLKIKMLDGTIQPNNDLDIIIKLRDEIVHYLPRTVSEIDFDPRRYLPKVFYGLDKKGLLLRSHRGSTPFGQMICSYRLAYWAWVNVDIAVKNFVSAFSTTKRPDEIIVFNITYLTYHTETWESTFELKKDLPSYQRSYL